MISFGPLDIPPALALIAGALVGAYLIGRYSTPAAQRESHALLFDALLNGVLLFALGWKLFPLLQSPGVVFNDPLALLYRPGGTGGVLFGAFLGGALLLRTLYRRRPLPGGMRRAVAGTAAGAALGAGAVLLLLTVTQGEEPPRPVGPAGAESGTEGVRNMLQGEEFELLSAGQPEPNWDAPYLVVNIWATWCPPCRGELPELADFYRSAAGGRVELVAVNLTATEKSTAEVRRFVRDRELPFPVLLDPQGGIRDLCGAKAVPTTCVFGPGGELIARRTGVVSAGWLERQIPAE